MPNNVNAGLSGAIVSLLAHLRNQARKNAAPGPEAPATPAAAPAPQVTAAVPAGSDSAARFDFAAPSVQAAPNMPGPVAPAPIIMAPPVALVPVAALSPAADASAPGSAPAPVARPSVPVAEVPARAPGGEAALAALRAGERKGAAAPAAEPAQAPEPATPDDEALARAWAVSSIARENRLSIIDRIARMAEPPPETAKASEEGAGAASRPPEPKTLARA